MTRTILLDCDDVLLNWVSGFAKWATLTLGRPITGEPGSWHMGEWLGTSDNQAFDMISQFNGMDFFGELEAVEGAVDAISRLKNSPKYRLHVVTSCSSDQRTVAMRRANLEAVFGTDIFDSIHCLDLGESKIKILQAWKPGAVWIEDNYKNALLGLDAGHRVLIRGRPHNAEQRATSDTRLEWFDNWSELESI